MSTPSIADKIHEAIKPILPVTEHDISAPRGQLQLAKVRAAVYIDAILHVQRLTREVEVLELIADADRRLADMALAELRRLQNAIATLGITDDQLKRAEAKCV